MSGIATSLPRYTPIYNSPFSYSLNLGARFLLGGRIVTTTTRTVREVTADSPRGVAQIFIWMGLGPTRQSSLLPLFLQSRAELEPRAIVAPCFDLPPPSTRPRFLAQEPSSSPPPPSQTPKPAYPRPESFHHRRTPLGVLEACSTADPPLRSSSTRTDRGNGFVVSPLCFTTFFFPFHGVSPAPEHGLRRRRRPCCRLVRRSEISYRGRSAWEERTVRLGGADGPPVRLVFVQRRCCLWLSCRIDCGRSAIRERTVRR